MTTIGVRALKAHLSAHLRRAEAGERIVVTDHGRAIATLGPAGPAEQPEWLVQLAREGRVRLGSGRRFVPRPRVKLKGGVTVSQAVIEDRR